MSSRRKATVTKAVALTAALGLAAAACSSGGGGSSGSSGGSGSGSTTTTGSNTAACNAAKPFLSAPKTIPLSVPLSKKPPTGKTIVITQNPEAVTLKTNSGFTQAAHMLGWKVKYVNVGTSAQGPQQALSAALQLHPSAIGVSGNPVSLFRSQLATAAAQNVPVLMNDNGSPAPGKYGPLYEIGLDADSQTGLWGKMTADYAACHGAKSVLVVDLPLYPILHAYSEGVLAELKRVAPSVHAQIMTTQITDLAGGAIPGKVVSAVQQDPSINWVLFCLGDMTTGLYAALRNAGLSTKVQVGGESASTANIQALKAKQNAVWTGFAAVIHGFYRADALARIFNGESLAPDNTSQLPTQLLTQQNVSTAPLDSSGYYAAYPNYASYFANLWKLNG